MLGSISLGGIFKNIVGSDIAGKVSRGLVTVVGKGLSTAQEIFDKGRRLYLESDEPDGTGRWDSEHRRMMLNYVYKRDGGRCGLCGGAMKIQGAQIEHIVPKVFATFGYRQGGKVVEGTLYKSRLHKIDNLQAAHSYCNKRKGNSPYVAKWRHATMAPLTVADTDDGRTFVVPYQQPDESGSAE